MAKDITLVCMLQVATHDLSYDPAKSARRLRKGDILQAFLSTTYADKDVNGDYRMWTQIGHPRFGFVHMTDVPNDKAEKIGRLVGALEGQQAHPHEDTVKRRHVWHVPPDELPAAIKTKILAEQEITVTWAQAKPFIRKKVIVDDLDPDQDDITTELTDEDLT